VKLLLDTHTFLWAVAAPRKMSARAATALRNRSNELHLSAASVWEMAIKRSLGKLETDIPLGDLIAQAREKIQLRLLDMTTAHAVSVEALPFHHKDPFDRLLIAQALWEEMTIVGADARFDSYGVKRVW
jgi:PIN domain nuclease of toxin-antitoxin system